MTYKSFTTGYRPYDNFANKYGIKSINVNRERRDIDYYNVKASYYAADTEETLDIEMNRRTFEYLVQVDEEYTRMWQDARDEMYMRKEHPAIKEAYEKYRMLLELYK
jgi:hypothetical protein